MSPSGDHQGGCVSVASWQYMALAPTQTISGPPKTSLVRMGIIPYIARLADERLQQRWLKRSVSCDMATSQHGGKGLVHAKVSTVARRLLYALTAKRYSDR
jgi:hypothetical protein